MSKIKTMEELKDKFPDGDINYAIAAVRMQLDEEFLSNNIARFPMFYISYYQKLSNDFIRKHYRFMNTEHIFARQEPDEELLEEIATHYNKSTFWYLISKHQKLSKEFVMRHLDDLDIDALRFNPKMDKKEMETWNLDMVMKMRDI